MKVRRLAWVLLMAMAVACRSETMTLHVDYAHAPGLSEGDRVLYESREAGRVRFTETRGDGRYRVDLNVERAFAHALTEDARFYVIDDPARDQSKAVEIRLERKGGAPLADGATVKGVSPEQDAVSQWRRDLEKGFEFFERQIDKYGRELEELPRSDAYRNLKESMKEWAAEMERAGEQARETIEDRWLPKIQQELEALEEWLREHGREEEVDPGKGDGSRNI